MREKFIAVILCATLAGCATFHSERGHVSGAPKVYIVFFPVQSLPWAPRLLAYVSPLWHGVELCRAATLGRPTAWGVPVHIGALVAWAVGGYLFARWRYAKKLAD